MVKLKKSVVHVEVENSRQTFKQLWLVSMLHEAQQAWRDMVYWWLSRRFWQKSSEMLKSQELEEILESRRRVLMRVPSRLPSQTILESWSLSSLTLEEQQMMTINMLGSDRDQMLSSVVVRQSLTEAAPPKNQDLLTYLAAQIDEVDARIEQRQSETQQLSEQTENNLAAIEEALKSL